MNETLLSEMLFVAEINSNPMEILPPHANEFLIYSGAFVYKIVAICIQIIERPSGNALKPTFEILSYKVESRY